MMAFEMNSFDHLISRSAINNASELRNKVLDELVISNKEKEIEDLYKIITFARIHDALDYDPVGNDINEVLF